MMKFVIIIFLSIIPLNLTNGICKVKEVVQQDKVEPKQREELIIVEENDYEKFRGYFAFREGSNNPDTINQFGYIGLFQFGKSALKAVGFGHINDSLFRLNPGIFPKEHQYIAFDRLVKINSWILRDYIKEYDGKRLHGYKITKAALIGAAHISGAGGVIRWIKDPRYNPQDAFGTKLTDYLVEFSHFKL